MQTLCIFILRCLKVTVVPFLMYSSLLWGIGVGGGYILAFQGFGARAPMESPSAFWFMSAVSLMMASASLAFLIRKEMQKRVFDKELTEVEL